MTMSVTRSKEGTGRTVYLNGVGLWLEGETIHIRVPKVEGGTTHQRMQHSQNPRLYMALKELVEKGDIPVMRRYDVKVECLSHPHLKQATVTVFAGTATHATHMAIEKIADKYARHQSLDTRWIVIDDPVEL